MNLYELFDLDKMSIKSVTILLLCVLDLCAAVTPISQNELKHVHVIFAHKLYAPLEMNMDTSEYLLPEQLSYEYFLENADDMPTEAKMDMYNLGVYLRRRYDTFLGDIFYTEVLKMRTSEYFLSMISGLLVNAGLWPPSESQRWNDDLDWLPIPTEYEPKERDSLFLGTLCPHFLDEEQRLLSLDESIKNEVSVHEQLFNRTSAYYGKKIESPSNMSMLYSYLETIASNRESNVTVPDWAEEIFSNSEMINVTLLSYDLLSKSKSQKQLNGGVFLKKIINESMYIIATNATDGRNTSIMRDPKISMYSGEERNVIGALQAMNLWWSPDLLENGASVIFELRYNKIAQQYGFEIYYYTGITDNETIGLTLPGCDVFCPLNDFTRIVDEILPIDEENLCHMRFPIHENNTSSADSHQHQNRRRHRLVLSLAISILLFVTY